jgi:hypothetical protein
MPIAISIIPEIIDNPSRIFRLSAIRIRLRQLREDHVILPRMRLQPRLHFQLKVSRQNQTCCFETYQALGPTCQRGRSDSVVRSSLANFSTTPRLNSLFQVEGPRYLRVVRLHQKVLPAV